MGANLKQNIVEGVRNMLASINEFARSHTSSGVQQEATPITAAPSEPEELPNEQGIYNVISIGFLHLYLFTYRKCRYSRDDNRKIEPGI